MSNYNIHDAAELWREVYQSGFNWECQNEVVRIAAMCGLGVLSVQARNCAAALIREDYRSGRSYDRARYDALARTSPEFALRWAGHLRDAARLHPTKTIYPIAEPPNHLVGGSGCYGSARKGQWSDECYRAAWGNVEPFGLALAEKPCPLCNETMHYWCWGKNGELARRWVIDHRKSHAAGGCVCHFNLQALHPHCNSAKGG